MNENDMTELNDLKQAWAKLDQRVDADFTRMQAMTSALATDRAQTLVRRALWLPSTELIAAGIGLVLAISCLFHRGGPVFLACSIAMLAFLVALIVSAVWQIVTIAGLDLAAPVVATQRQLGRVRAHRIFATKWVLLLSPVLWIPFFVVGVELLFGAEGTAIFTPGYLLANLLVGLAISAVLLWLSRRLAERLRDSSFLRRLLDDIAGRRLVAARGFLARLDGFERE